MMAIAGVRRAAPDALQSDAVNIDVELRFALNSSSLVKTSYSWRIHSSVLLLKA